MSGEKLDTRIRQSQIAEAVLEIIATRGIKNLNVAAVARRVGLVPSAIYRHFRSKDEMLAAVLDHLRERLLENISIVCEESDDSLERLHRLLRRHIRLIRENQALPRIIFSESVFSGNIERRSKARKTITIYLSNVADIIREGQRDGRIRRDAKADMLAVMFLGLIQPPAVLWHLTDGEFDVTKQTEKAWRVFCAAIEKVR